MEYADRIRRNDKSLTEALIGDWKRDIETLDALKNNTVVKKVSILGTDYLLPKHQEALAKLSDVMKCNKSVEYLNICLLEGEIPSERNRLFALLASIGWWSIQELVLYDRSGYTSLRVSEDVSNFILQSENLRTLRLDMAGDEAALIMETLPRTKVQSLNICFHSPFSLQNGGRQLAAALERCTCITELGLKFTRHSHQVEFFPLLFLESIPKMLGLKKLELDICGDYNGQVFDKVGQCLGGHQGEIEELEIIFNSTNVNISIVGLAPALRRLKVIRFIAPLTSQQIGELSEGAADCDTLEEFFCRQPKSTDDFNAIRQLCSRFPSLKRVSQNFGKVLREEGSLTAFLEMVKTSKTIEEVPPFRCRTNEDEATLKRYCRNNMMHNRIELVRQTGLLAATVPNSAWSLILKELSEMPDVLYYLLQQKHGAMIGPTCHGCKRKQDFD